MILPRFEAQVQWRKLGKTFAESLVHDQVHRHLPRSVVGDRLVVVHRHAVAQAAQASAAGHDLGFRLPVIWGAFSCSVGYALMALFHAHPYQLLLAGILCGSGVGLAYAGLANLIVESAPREKIGMASGINTVMRSVGSALGAQISASVIAGTIIAGEPRVGGFTTVFVNNQSAGLYDHYFNTFLVPTDLLWSFLQAIVMAIAVMLVHTYYGYNASGGPVGVGIAVGQAVRTSLIVVVTITLFISLAVYGASGNFNLSG